MAINGLLGKKIGTTKVFRDTGEADCVTAIEVGPCTITQIKTKENDGYESVQIGFIPVTRLNKPKSGHLIKVNTLFRYLREFTASDLSGVEGGEQVDVSIFEPGERIDASGLSKGRGFAGGVKRHHFKGGPKTHGQSDRHRAPGSIGAGTSPGRVLKGLKMAGHMGNANVRAKNLEVVSSDPEKNILLVKGSVPGARNSLIILSKRGSRRK